MTATDYRAKAAIAAQAWLALFGKPISLNALTLVLAVGDLETGLGNVPGHNWGSVHKRTLTPDEHAILEAHSLLPSAANLAEARTLLAPGPSEMLFVDTGPDGAYFVWLWAFPDDLSAATKFLQVLVQQRAGVRAILDTATPLQLAAAMYDSKYFTGNSTDAQTNVNAYAALIAKHAQAIAPVLSGAPQVAPSSPPSSPVALPKAAGAGAGIVLLAVLLGIAAFKIHQAPAPPEEVEA
jgi:hypothetical protein